LADGNHWVAKEYIYRILARVELWLARDKVILYMAHLGGAKNLVIAVFAIV
jgi:hypothetical protein